MSVSARRSVGRAPAPAAVPQPRQRRNLLTRRLLLTLLGKLIGLAILLGSSGLLYDVASSAEFRVNRVSVVGNRLLAAEELEAAAGVRGFNLFWVRRPDVAQRLGVLPPIETANVSLELPGHVLIEVKEREPVAIWLAGETPYLVDRNGLILAARPAERPLPMIRDTTSQQLGPGSRVSADAVRSLANLEAVLTRTFGPQQRQYEYASELGLNVVQSTGPRLIFGTGDQLEWKISAIQTIVRHLETTKTTAELIDVRFGDRPYYR